MARFHRNLHNARRGGPQWVETKGGKVQAYLDSVLLTNVTTRIQPAGAAKCRETGVRAVCAFFDGDRFTGEAGAYVGTGQWFRIGYDPRKDSAFHAVIGSPDRWDGGIFPFNRAAAVRLDEDGSAWVLDPLWEVK